MKIVDLRVWVVNADWRNWIFLKLYTDEGVTGVGESGLSGQEQTVVAALRAMQEYLVGQDPLPIERHWRNLYHGSFWRGTALLSALGGVEMALWDIFGKVTGQPVVNLLGGSCRERVRCYTHISEAVSGHTVEARVAEAQQAVAEGWTAMKWDPIPTNHLTLEPAQVRDVAEQLRAVREAVGPDVELMVEAHGRLDPTAAIQVAKAIASYRPFFLEEPVPPDSLDALQKVADHVDIPLATGERVFTRFGYWPILAQQCVDYIQPDVIHAGGLLECKKIAAMAETRYIRVAPHNPNGPVATAAALHLAANLPNFAILEMPADDYLWAARWRDEFLVDPTLVQVKDGYLATPTAPGLGVELDEVALARHPVAVRGESTATHAAYTTLA